MKSYARGSCFLILGITVGILVSQKEIAVSKDAGEVLRVREIKVVGPSGEDAIVLSADAKGPSIKLIDPSKTSELLLSVRKKEDSTVDSRIIFKNLENDSSSMTLSATNKNTALLTMQDAYRNSPVYLSHNSESSIFTLGELTYAHLVAEATKKKACLEINALLSPGLQIQNSEEARPKVRSFERVNGVLSNFKEVKFDSVETEK